MRISLILCLAVLMFTLSGQFDALMAKELIATWTVPADNAGTAFEGPISGQYLLRSETPITRERIQAAIDENTWGAVSGLYVIAQPAVLSPGQIASYTFVVEYSEKVMEFAVVAYDGSGNFSISNVEVEDSLMPSPITDFQLLLAQ